MNQNLDMQKERFAKSNTKASGRLLIPAALAFSGFYLSGNTATSVWITGQLILGFFFLQCFILLHETGHGSFFDNKTLNQVSGTIFGFLSFIPYYNWKEIHNLHHRWTGWRDKDPTTEITAQPQNKGLVHFINFSWLFSVPIFILGYMLGNYWNIGKLKRFLAPSKYKKATVILGLHLGVYIGLFYCFSHFAYHYLLLALVIGLMLKELVILTQHSHVDIPIAGAKQVKPIRYKDQVEYSRSVYFPQLFAKYFLFNFNLHEAHHAYPGVPSYQLHHVKIQSHNSSEFFTWLYKAKSMKGIDYIFSTTKNTGVKI
jgi:omega-6 fatty acid desaturase (delta-12 desaturase)